MNSENNLESRMPPIATTGLLGWLRMNLFSNWFNSFLTIGPFFLQILLIII